MRHVNTYIEWKAGWWRTQSVCRSVNSRQLQRGLTFYAEKQARICERLAACMASFWVNYLKAKGPLLAWIELYQQHARRV